MTYLLAFLLLHPLLLVLFALWARTGWKVFAAIGLPVDVLLNFTTASLIWGWPQRGEWTISKRLKRQRFEVGKRAIWAWRLAEWLNKHDPGHV